jgi:hypothetical protein
MSKSSAGTYVFDPKLGKVVKKSDRIPGVSGRKTSPAPKRASGPTGGACCGGGRCAGN